MSTAAATLHSPDAHAEGASPATSKFGMIIFLISEAMLFAGLIGGYIVLRISDPGDWPPPGAPNINVNFGALTALNVVMLINSAILIGSSFTLHAAEASIKKHGKSGLGWMLLTIIMGTVFLSVQAWEWAHLYHEGMWFETAGIYSSCFFVMTGFHGLHVLVGLLLIIWCFFKQLLFGAFTKEKHVFFENTGIYWHFVDVVWIFLFVVLYVV